MVIEETLEMEVTTALYDIFTCPSCRNVMTPPIYMCDLGHSFCGNCYYNIDRCPTCRATISARRNVAIERIQSNFVFPCSNEDDGCKFSGPVVYLREHEMFCKYSLMQCELKVDNCKWTGTRENSVNHCAQNHPENVVNASQQTFAWKKLEDASVCRILINAYDKQFLCVWFFENADHANLSVSLLGSVAEAANFYYSIEIGSGDDWQHTRVYKRHCHSSKACKIPRADIHVFANLRNIVKSYSDRQEFYYTVTIYNYNVTFTQLEEERKNRVLNVNQVVCPKWQPIGISEVEPILF
ncbi:hypothetical protein FQR65_LT10901 [Abscondita terminalis]|nr:hypothetical protein FQR65_LT10901 [Abscondita terminalis]